ncbi:MAG TPA: LLM class flavin-dependent oxidoreductase [Acidimicrobiia bacterium]|nr:LLM class flavin-dependent oxidoreductase [Acidimicrobiia bacterium]
MRFGITLPHYDYSLDSSSPISFDDVARAATSAEQAGFDAIYVSDHLSLDLAKYGGSVPLGGGSAPQFHSLDPLSTLAALSAITSTVTLGTLVLCEALRHPVMTAAIAHTIADISGGRFSLGMGAGWYDPDYEIYGNEIPPVGERMTRLSESVRIIRALFDGDTIEIDGEFYSSRGATLSSPLAGSSYRAHDIPLFLGGKGDRFLRIVARYAQGWNTCWAFEFDAYAERVSSLHRACEKYDRDPASVYQSLGLYCMVADTEKELHSHFDEIVRLSPDGVADGKTLEMWRQGRLVGTTEQVAHQLVSWSELGVREIIVNPGFAPFHVGSIDVIDHLGDCLRRARDMAGLSERPMTNTASPVL